MDPSELEILLDSQKDRRLGKYFETLWFYWFSKNPRYEIIENKSLSRFVLMELYRSARDTILHFVPRRQNWGPQDLLRLLARVLPPEPEGEAGVTDHQAEQTQRPPPLRGAEADPRAPAPPPEPPRP